MEYGQFCPVARATEVIGEKDYDVELLMIYLKRSIIPEKLVGNETVIRFHFTDTVTDTCPDWWLVVKDKELDLCVNDPDRDVDVYFTSSVKTLADVWMGDSTYRKAIKDGRLKVVGNTLLTRNISAWMSNSLFAGLPSASEI